MKVRLECPACDASYLVKREQIAGKSARFTCQQCAAAWKVALTEDEVTLTPLDGSQTLCPNCGHTFQADAVPFAAPGRPRILVAEDHDFFLEMAHDALGQKYETVSVRTATACLAEIARADPDLLVLDLMLADGDNGLEILRQLPERRFPVLVYTSRDEELIYGKLWSSLQELGVNDILIKGMNVGDELRRKVESLLQSPS